MSCILNLMNVIVVDGDKHSKFTRPILTTLVAESDNKKGP